MTTPLSQELEDILVELNECGGMIHDDQYTAEQRDSLLKLQSLGLVKSAWVMTGRGMSRYDEDGKLKDDK